MTLKLGSASDQHGIDVNKVYSEYFLYLDGSLDFHVQYLIFGACSREVFIEESLYFFLSNISTNINAAHLLWFQFTETRGYILRWHIISF